MYEVSTVFVPEDLCKANPKLEHIEAPMKYDCLEDNSYIREKFETFNRNLGAVALMKIVKGKNPDFSDDFLPHLSNFNPYIRQQIEEHEEIIEKPQFYKI